MWVLLCRRCSLASHGGGADAAMLKQFMVTSSDHEYVIKLLLLLLLGQKAVHPICWELMCPGYPRHSEPNSVTALCMLSMCLTV